MASAARNTHAIEQRTVVELIDVHRRFDVGQESVAALDGLTLALDARKVVAITGPSGAGKSSLLHILGVLDVQTSGRLIINGTDITAAGDRAKSAFRLHNIGFVFQSFNLLPTLTAWENVALPRLFAGGSMRSAQNEAVQLLERVGLGQRVGHRPNQLSGGEVQRVAIARALIMKPSIILADEPTGNLDSKASQEIMGLFREIVASEHTSLSVVVTHNLELAKAFADRVICIRDGRIESDSAQQSRT